jgi:predicted nuclease with TOPRIM domain
LHKENEKLERLKKENEELTDKIKRLEHDNGGLLRQLELLANKDEVVITHLQKQNEALNAQNEKT